MSNIFNQLQQKFYDDFRANKKAPEILECPASDKFALQRELNTSDHWWFVNGELFLFNPKTRIIFI